MVLSDKFIPLFELLDDKVREEKYSNIRYVVLSSGRGSGKSHALATWVNQATYKDGWGVLFTRWEMTSAEKSIIPEFKKISELMNNDRDFSFKRTQVVNNMTGTVIDYAGLKPSSNNSTGALKSVSKKNILVVEESEDVYNFELFDKKCQHSF